MKNYTDCPVRRAEKAALWAKRQQKSGAKADEIDRLTPEFFRGNPVLENKFAGPYSRGISHSSLPPSRFRPKRSSYQQTGARMAEKNSALAAGSVLAEMNSSGALALALPSSEVQAAIRDSAEEYLRLVDGLLSGGEISHTSVEVPQKYAQYAYAMTVSGTGLGGNTLTYTLYYNENLSSEEIDGKETEREYDIEGVLSTPNGDYAVRGGRESESEYDKDESEEEEELWFNAYIGDNSYIRVEQESERESEDGEEELERSHLISLIENGKVVESTTVDLEQEDGETEVELTVKRDGAVDKLQFTRETRGGKDILYARAQFSAGDASFRVYVEDGGYRFEFVDGDEDDDFDDDDDDDRPYGGRH